MITETMLVSTLLPPALLSLFCVIGLVVSDHRNFLGGRFIFKPLAAMAFIWLALLAGAVDSQYGRILLVGLLLAAAGDVFLMFESQRAFLAGLVSFLCGHLLYAVAFVQLPVHTAALAWSVLPATLLVAGALIWLRGHLPGAMNIAVPAYMLVIAAMLVFAGGTWSQPGATLIIAGAWGFALSDLAVARRQFISTDPINKLWGTPLYFGSQMLLAASVAYYAA